MRKNIDARLTSLLSWWQAEIRAVLGEKMQSVLLGGSTVLVDFQPGWSDVDVCVVLHDAITEAEGTAIGKVHDAMRARFIEGRQDGWCSGQAIEGAYVTADMLWGMKPGVCYIAGGTTRWWGEADPLSPFDRFIYAHHGICLLGSAVSVGMPDMASLKVQSTRDARHFAHPPANCLDSAIWLAGIMHWLARSIVFWRDGGLLSKTAALEREIAAGGLPAPYFVLPLALRREGSAACQRHIEELRQNYLNAVEPALRALTEVGVYTVEEV